MRIARFFLTILTTLLLATSAFAQTTGAPLDPLTPRMESIEALQAEVETLVDDRKKAADPEKEEFDARIAEKRAELRTNIAELVTELTSNDAASDVMMQRARRLLKADAVRIGQELDTAEAAVTELRGEIAAATDSAEKVKLEDQLARRNARLVELLGAAIENASRREAVGIDVKRDLRKIDERLLKRARGLAALIEATRAERAALRERPATTDEEKKARDRDLKLVDKRLSDAADTMAQLITLMKSRELETTEYQQQLIEATGRVTKDVLDARVTMGLMERWVERAEAWVLENAPQAIFGLIVFALLLLLAKILSVITRKVMRRSVERTEMSELAKDFTVTMTGRGVMAIGVLTGLSQLGIEMGPMLAGLGIAGFIIGFALQDTLSNFASGIMILVYRPFDIGDLIEVAGVTGTVNRMTLVSTSILTLDNQRLVVPNNKIWNDVIRNVTAQTTRRVDLKFGIGYGDDIDHARDVLMDIVAGVELGLDDPAPVVAVHELGDSSVNFVVRVWTDTPNYWNVYWEITAEVKRRFDAEGISIPFPQRDVHLFQDAA